MEINPLWMFVPLFIFILLGHPLGFVLGGVGLTFGLISEAFGIHVFYLFAHCFYSFQVNYLVIALPLFIFMGYMLERSGSAEDLYSGIHIWMGPIRGGLALATVFVCTIFAAAVGIIGASVTAMGLLALPEMLKRHYEIEFAAGTVMTASCLGILIPPSIMLVLYGAWANISVGQLFMACIMPGLLLSALYCAYILIRSGIQPGLAPALPKGERQVPFRQKSILLLTGIFPPLFLILAVLGTIFFGICTPSEAAAMGAVGSIIIAVIKRKLTWKVMKESLYRTATVTGMIAIIAVGALCFTSVFLGLRGGIIVRDLMLGIGLGPTGLLAVMMFILFILGMFIDWGGIIMVCIPIFVPLLETLGWNPLWFAVLVCVNLQMSFLTPPFGFALFYMKGIAPPGVTMAHLMRSIVPYLGLIIIGLVLCIAFPQIALWLPGVMIGR